LLIFLDFILDDGFCLFISRFYYVVGFLLQLLSGLL